MWVSISAPYRLFFLVEEEVEEEEDKVAAAAAAAAAPRSPATELSKMPDCCAAAECKQSTNQPSVAFFRFPLDPERQCSPFPLALLSPPSTHPPHGPDWIGVLWAPAGVSEHSYTNTTATASFSKHSYTTASISKHSYTNTTATASFSKHSYTNTTATAGISKHSYTNTTATASISEHSYTNTTATASFSKHSYTSTTATASISKHSYTNTTATASISKHSYTNTTATASISKHSYTNTTATAGISKHSYTSTTATPTPLLQPASVNTATPTPLLQPASVNTATPTPLLQPALVNTATPAPLLQPASVNTTTPAPLLQPASVNTATPTASISKHSYTNTTATASFSKHSCTGTAATAGISKHSYTNTTATAGISKHSCTSTTATASITSISKHSYTSTTATASISKHGYTTASISKHSYTNTTATASFSKHSYINTTATAGISKHSYTTASISKHSYTNTTATASFSKHSCTGTAATAGISKHSYTNTTATAGISKHSCTSTTATASITSISKHSYTSTTATASFSKHSYTSTTATASFSKHSYTSTTATASFSKHSYTTASISKHSYTNTTATASFSKHSCTSTTATAGISKHSYTNTTATASISKHSYTSATATASISKHGYTTASISKHSYTNTTATASFSKHSYINTTATAGISKHSYTTASISKHSYINTTATAGISKHSYTTASISKHSYTNTTATAGISKHSYTTASISKHSYTNTTATAGISKHSYTTASISKHSYTNTTATASISKHSYTTASISKHSYINTTATAGISKHSYTTASISKHSYTNTTATASISKHSYTNTTATAGISKHSYTTASICKHSYTNTTATAGISKHSYTTASISKHSYTNTTATASISKHSYTTASISKHSYTTASISKHSYINTTATAGISKHSYTTASISKHSHTNTTATASISKHSYTTASISKHSYTNTTATAGISKHSYTTASISKHSYTNTTATAGISKHSYTTASISKHSYTNTTATASFSKHSYTSTTATASISKHGYTTASISKHSYTSTAAADTQLHQHHCYSQLHFSKHSYTNTTATASFSKHSYTNTTATAGISKHSYTNTTATASFSKHSYTNTTATASFSKHSYTSTTATASISKHSYTNTTATASITGISKHSYTNTTATAGISKHSYTNTTATAGISKHSYTNTTATAGFSKHSYTNTTATAGFSKHSYTNTTATASISKHSYTSTTATASNSKHSYTNTTATPLLTPNTTATASISKHSYTSTTATASNSKHSYTTTTATASFSKHSYTNTTATASISKHSYTSTTATASFSKHSYTNTTATASFSKHSCTGTTATASFSKHSYTNTTATASISKHSYTNTTATAGISKHSYTNTTATASISKHSYTGTTATASISKHSYTNTTATASFSKHSYTNTTATASFSKHSYTNTTATASFSKHSYTSTTATASFSKHSYTNTTATASISKHSYTSTTATASFSKHSYTGTAAADTQLHYLFIMVLPVGGGLSVMLVSLFICRCREWVGNCGRPDLQTKTPEYLHRNFKLCSKHFEASLIHKESELKCVLKDGAVPTIFNIMTNKDDAPKSGRKRTKPAVSPVEPVLSSRHTISQGCVSPGPGGQPGLQVSPLKHPLQAWHLTYEQAAEDPVKAKKTKGNPQAAAPQQGVVEDPGKNSAAPSPPLDEPEKEEDPATSKAKETLKVYFKETLAFTGFSIVNHAALGATKSMGSGPAGQLTINPVCAEQIESKEVLKLGEDVMREEIRNSLRLARFYSILLQDKINIEGKDQIPVFVRTVTNDGFPQKHLMGFLPCDVDSDSLFLMLVSEIRGKWGLRMEHCRGFTYLTTGSLCQKLKELSCRMLRDFPQVVLAPSDPYAFNMWLIRSLPVLSVQDVVDTVEEVAAVLRQSETLMKKLHAKIALAYSHIKGEVDRVKEACQNNWEYGTDAFQTMLDILEPLLNSIGEMCTSALSEVDTAIVEQLLKLKDKLKNFNFIISLVVLKNTLCCVSILNPSLRGIISISSTLQYTISNALKLLNKHLQEIPIFHRKWFSDAVGRAKKLGVAVTLPVETATNGDAEAKPQPSPEDYYRETLSKMILQYLIDEVKRVLGVEMVRILRWLSLVPSYMADHNFSIRKDKVADANLNNLARPDSFYDELGCWEVKWRHASKRRILPTSVFATLKIPDIGFYPNVQSLLRVLGSIPCINADADVYGQYDMVLDRYHSYMKEVPVENRLCNMAFVYVNQDVHFNIEDMVQSYVESHPDILQLLCKVSGLLGSQVWSLQRPGIPPPPPYRICRNCVRMFKLHGMDYHRTPSGTSTAPYRDVWRVGLANTAARRHTERQTSDHVMEVQPSVTENNANDASKEDAEEPREMTLDMELERQKPADCPGTDKEALKSALQAALTAACNSQSRQSQGGQEAEVEYVTKSEMNEVLKVCEDVVRERILSEVGNSFFSLFVDRAVRLGEADFLPLFLRFVDSFDVMRLELLGFVDVSLDTESMCERLFDMVTKEWQLDLRLCRGQAYLGSGEVSYKLKAFACKVQETHPLAICTHCSCYSFNTWWSRSVPVLSVSRAIDTLEKVVLFFSSMPDLEKELDQVLAVGLRESYEKVHELQGTFCSSWLEKHDSYDVFALILEPLAQCLESFQSGSGPQSWGLSVITQARKLLQLIRDFDFIVALVALKNVSSFTRELSAALQKDHFSAASQLCQISGIVATLNRVKTNIKVFHQNWFEEACAFAQNLGVQIKVPDSVTVPRDSLIKPGGYYKDVVSLPLVDHLINSVKDHFSDDHKEALNFLSLVPCSVTVSYTFESLKSKPPLYVGDLPDPENFFTELSCWKVKWKTKVVSPTIPDTIFQTLRLPLMQYFANINTLLKIMCVLPSTALEYCGEVKRHKMFQDYLRNTYAKERSPCLAMLQVGANFNRDLDRMVAQCLKFTPNTLEGICLDKESKTLLRNSEVKEEVDNHKDEVEEMDVQQIFPRDKASEIFPGITEVKAEDNHTAPVEEMDTQPAPGPVTAEEQVKPLDENGHSGQPADNLQSSQRVFRAAARLARRNCLFSKLSKEEQDRVVQELSTCHWSQGNVQCLSDADILESMVKSIREAIICEVQESPFFSIITDKMVAVDDQKYVPVFVRYVDDCTPKVALLGFLPFDGGSDVGVQAKTLSDTLTEEWGLQMGYCRGQSFMCMGASSQSLRSMSLDFLASYPLAVNTPSESCGLAYWLAVSLHNDPVTKVLGVVEDLLLFFDQSPRLHIELSQTMEGLLNTPREALAEVPETCLSRWKKMEDFFDVLVDMLEGVLSCLDSVSNNANGTWSNSMSIHALILSTAIRESDFVIPLVILKNACAPLRNCSTVFRCGNPADIMCELEKIPLIVESLSKMLENVGAVHAVWFEEAAQLAAKVAGGLSYPDTLGSYESPEAGYRETVSVPVLSGLVEEMKVNFSEGHLKALKVLSLLPTCNPLPILPEATDKLYTIYLSDLPDPDTAEDDINTWATAWREKYQDVSPPASISETLHHPEAKSHPNVTALLKLVAVLPSISMECDLMKTTLNSLRSFLRNDIICRGSKTDTVMVLMHRQALQALEDVIDRCLENDPESHEFLSQVCTSPLSEEYILYIFSSAEFIVVASEEMAYETNGSGGPEEAQYTTLVVTEDQPETAAQCEVRELNPPTPDTTMAPEGSAMDQDAVTSLEGVQEFTTTVPCGSEETPSDEAAGHQDVAEDFRLVLEDPTIPQDDATEAGPQSDPAETLTEEAAQSGSTEAVTDVAAQSGSTEAVTEVAAQSGSTEAVTDVAAQSGSTEALTEVAAQSGSIEAATEVAAPSDHTEAVMEVPAQSDHTEAVTEVPAPDDGTEAVMEVAAQSGSIEVAAQSDSTEAMTDVAAPSDHTEAVTEVAAPSDGTEAVTEVAAQSDSTGAVTEVAAQSGSIEVAAQSNTTEVASQGDTTETLTELAAQNASIEPITSAKEIKDAVQDVTTDCLQGDEVVALNLAPAAPSVTGVEDQNDRTEAPSQGAAQDVPTGSVTSPMGVKEAVLDVTTEPVSGLTAQGVTTGLVTASEVVPVGLTTAQVNTAEPVNLSTPAQIVISKPVPAATDVRLEVSATQDNTTEIEMKETVQEATTGPDAAAEDVPMEFTEAAQDAAVRHVSDTATDLAAQGMATKPEAAAQSVEVDPVQAARDEGTETMDTAEDVLMDLSGTAHNVSERPTTELVTTEPVTAAPGCTLEGAAPTAQGVSLDSTREAVQDVAEPDALVKDVPMELPEVSHDAAGEPGTKLVDQDVTVEAKTAAEDDPMENPEVGEGAAADPEGEPAAREVVPQPAAVRDVPMELSDAAQVAATNPATDLATRTVTVEPLATTAEVTLDLSNTTHNVSTAATTAASHVLEELVKPEQDDLTEPITAAQGSTTEPNAEASQGGGVYTTEIQDVTQEQGKVQDVSLEQVKKARCVTEECVAAAPDVTMGPTQTQNAATGPVTSPQGTCAQPTAVTQEADSEPAPEGMSVTAENTSDVQAVSTELRADVQDITSEPIAPSQDTPTEPTAASQDTTSEPTAASQDTPTAASQDTPTEPTAASQDTPTAASQDTPTEPTAASQDITSEPTAASQDTPTEPRAASQDTPTEPITRTLDAHRELTEEPGADVQNVETEVLAAPLDFSKESGSEVRNVTSEPSAAAVHVPTEATAESVGTHTESITEPGTDVRTVTTVPTAVTLEIPTQSAVTSKSVALGSTAAHPGVVMEPAVPTRFESQDVSMKPMTTFPEVTMAPAAAAQRVNTELVAPEHINNAVSVTEVTREDATAAEEVAMDTTEAAQYDASAMVQGVPTESSVEVTVHPAATSDDAAMEMEGAVQDVAMEPERDTEEVSAEPTTGAQDVAMEPDADIQDVDMETVPEGQDVAMHAAEGPDGSVEPVAAAQCTELETKTAAGPDQAMPSAEAETCQPKVHAPQDCNKADPEGQDDEDRQPVVLSQGGASQASTVTLTVSKPDSPAVERSTASSERPAEDVSNQAKVSVQAGAVQPCTVSQDGPGHARVVTQAAGQDQPSGAARDAARGATLPHKPVFSFYACPTQEAFPKERAGSTFFSIVFDQEVEIESHPYIPVGICYLDDQTVCEDVLAFVPLDQDLNVFLGSVITALSEKCGLNLALCRGQSVRTVGVAGAQVRALASSLSQRYPRAVRTLNSPVSLNTWLARSSTVTQIAESSLWVEKVLNWLTEDAEKRAKLQSMVTSLFQQDEGKSGELRDKLATGQWERSHDLLELAAEILEAIVLCLNDVKDSHENQAERGQALDFLSVFQDFEFVLSVVIMKNVLGLTKAFSRSLQGEPLGLYQAVNGLPDLLSTLTDMAANVDGHLQTWFQEAVVLVSKLKVDVDRSLQEPLIGRYREVVSRGAIEHSITEIRDLFSDRVLSALRCMQVVPYVLSETEGCCVDTDPFEVFREDLPDWSSLHAELQTWREKWLDSTTTQQPLPSCVLNTLQAAGVKAFPNVEAVLRLLSLLPCCRKEGGPIRHGARCLRDFVRRPQGTLEHPHTVPADGAVGVEVEGHQAFWTLISVLTTVPPHTDSLGVSTKTKAGLVTEDDPLPF
ncbi:hypothetical protein NFI96_034491 [Prochilodus magdalenae]|nr:hypothetical protein NFI96_034491 [Prochilodus magdalenae]